MRFLRSLVSWSFLAFWDIIFFSFFFHLRFSLPAFPATCNFLFLQAFWSFPDYVVLFLPLFLVSCFFFCFFLFCFVFVFVFFHYQHNTFLTAKFYSYILVIYSCSLHQAFQFFFIFGKYLDTVNVHKVVGLSLWCYQFRTPWIFFCILLFNIVRMIDIHFWSKYFLLINHHVWKILYATIW